MIASLGQPPRWLWQASFSTGVWFEGPGSQLMVRAAAASYHDLIGASVGVAQVGGEGFIGLKDTDADGGLRAIFRIPFIGVGAGAEYDFLDADLNFLVTAQTPVLRGGILAHGGMLRLDWYPTESGGFTLGITVPLWNRFAGRGRPTSAHATGVSEFPKPKPYVVRDVPLEAALDTLRLSATWVRRLTTPFLDQDGRTLAIADQRNAEYLSELQAHLALRSAEAEVRHFHRSMDRAFALASGSEQAGALLADSARRILLDAVLLPYDRQLGRKQWREELADLVVAARGRFGGSVAGSRLVAPGRVESVLYVFQELTGAIETERARMSTEWDDPRLVWLPLQYALLPEDHDTQVELDALIEQATEETFTDGNQVLYAAGLQFPWELRETIEAARDYHVLMIHDFPAVTDAGVLDSASLGQVLVYLDALRARVGEYDSVGTLPVYFIFLDQHYYALRKGRVWMDVLQDPLHASSDLPNATPAQVAMLAESLRALRIAVGRSVVLQAQARQYGDAWLRNRVKVQVNITNRADQSFWSGGLFSSFFAYPDNLLRDHRKVALFDVSERDPYRGYAVYTGMGVGELYLGPGWEDRSIVVRGPVLVALKDEVRALLRAQGLPADEIPLPLRAEPTAAGDPVPPAGARWDQFDARALQLTNGTGFQSKSIDVAKALLYSLMPPGSVIKIPDSLWNSFLYGGLLAGACLRGATVLIIAPAAANAPSAGTLTMSRSWEFLSRLLAARQALAIPIAAAGGDLHLGLYALAPDEQGMASRVESWNRNVSATPFLRTLMPFLPDAWPDLTGTPQLGLAASTIPPKLHQKVQFLGTRSMWNAIAAAPEWPGFMRVYLEHREATYAVNAPATLSRELPESLQVLAAQIYARTRGVPGAASYALVGSQNQDNRGMFMDGEVDLLFTGAESLVPLVDLIFIEGTATWLTDQASLDRLVPPPGAYMRRWGRVAKDQL
jgi:hypothetical protein